ncbi:MAG: hypothetical protein A2X05_12775 [Bacteroidetes bacterium GWE2_41_25]|nr:MAG: hypothetical protein A2X03_09435 [Bacteroidetes bacterium GWA2_40_15]OFX92911.1 MAG: hypothetical protein A2X06_15965 [Bacteroidetes bacterium GWC2_40_22]OFY09371.1 MAG: hypothetical protein A2X05_12775 [Bacteroidetes bacterium GWE2_41_25]OFY59622.1 MAG: hypothetical protein A2X04_17145 [Bacteroidetes bacterium GWF2_41_9]HAM10370.1 hypothetical protein [Bacteroidales bacterium]
MNLLYRYLIKYYRKICICLLFSVLIALVPCSPSTLTATQLFNRKVRSDKDTSVVSMHVTKALEYAYHSKNIENIRAHIDSAEAVCIEKNIEFPTLLHLARAEYFMLTSDFRNASQEGTIAMNKAKGNNENEIIAQTLNFFGRYSFRTGFYFESVDYFKSSIELARKYKVKILVPWNYNNLANLYNSIGDINEYINSLQMVIESAAINQDTIFSQNRLYKTWFGTSG